MGTDQNPAMAVPQASSEVLGELYTQYFRRKKPKLKIPDVRFRDNIGVPTERSGS